MPLQNTMARKKSLKGSNNNKKKTNRLAAVTIGASAGGLVALKQIVSQIDKNFKIPIIIVQHLHPESDDFVAKTLDTFCHSSVLEANEKEKISEGKIYLAPANYHLLIEDDFTFSLTIDPKVNYCRPSIDVLFESAARVYNSRLIGILLTGANIDGAAGLKKIKSLGGITIVQDPKTAEVDIMPQSAVNLFQVDYILPLQNIYPKIKFLTENC